MQIPDLAHMAATLVSVPAPFAQEKLASAQFVGGWSLGSMDLQSSAPNVFRGRSLFDDSEAYVEIRPVPASGLIDYAVGQADKRYPRIFIRITPGTHLGYGDDCCLVTLHAMRSAEANDQRWARTCISHEAEILLIQAQLQRAYALAPA